MLKQTDLFLSSSLRFYVIQNLMLQMHLKYRLNLGSKLSGKVFQFSVNLGNILNFSKPPFPHLNKKENTGSSVI